MCEETKNDYKLLGYALWFYNFMILNNNYFVQFLLVSTNVLFEATASMVYPLACYVLLKMP